MTSTQERQTVPSYSKFYVGGRWTEPTGSDRIDVISPSTEEVISRVPAPTADDVDSAVAAARKAFDGPWRRTSAEQRGQVLHRIADEIERRVPEFANVFAAEIGAPLAVGQAFHAMSVDMFRQNAELHNQVSLTEVRTDNGDTVKIVREPVGVVGAIIPWNGPVAAAAFKLGPALAAGCTVVLKPAPEGPLTTYMLAECLEAAGVPDGVVNILPAGREVGEHLVRHPGIDKIAFTGSTAAGKRIASICGERIARVTLELGGKSAGIIADDAVLEDVLPTLLPAGIGHSGQVCAAITRVLVPRSREAEFAEAMGAALSGMIVGDPFDPSTALGPLAIERQRDRVEDYIGIGRTEGAKLVTGGGRPAGLVKGFYIEPTLFTGVDNSMRIAREEIFGPVISLITYDGIDEAIAIANDSPYGLSGSVYTNDPNIAERVVSEVRTGQIFVNNAGTCVSQPFGGYKESGQGREGGPEGIAGYLETKMIRYA
ncbi:aldehyde dehydrogenase [[Mycobacterium] nativiensis]|uniref:Aldehyde dehydrogenase n=1 Tax=[Mycobacterium] nativiensis TaxID=2855503 RepID=A0ABU5XV37_9MYCO|nr:aldehyde dehydrogenase [Mycolicibacter sp. MYC340]MEB3031803.1 aldehyde dehydrogenase [Mycolicibacter sp. MYC340]